MVSENANMQHNNQTNITINSKNNEYGKKTGTI